MGMVRWIFVSTVSNKTDMLIEPLNHEFQYTAHGQMWLTTLLHVAPLIHQKGTTRAVPTVRQVGTNVPGPSHFEGGT
jgi:hypothetical protein